VGCVGFQGGEHTHLAFWQSHIEVNIQWNTYILGNHGEFGTLLKDCLALTKL
jgi:hypothetical protein